MGKIKESKKNMTLPKKGTPCRVKKKIKSEEDCEGFLVHEKYLSTRSPGKSGKYMGWVPGAGGDLWIIEHEDSTVAVYSFDEIKDI